MLDRATPEIARKGTVMPKRKKQRVETLAMMLLAGIFAGGISTSPLTAQSTAPSGQPASTSTPYRNQPNRIANREAAYYEAVWGIEAPSVKAVESGVILRFSYRVVDAEKARPLHDKKLDPFLESPEKGVRLVIPSLEKVGQLRQAPQKIEIGKSYWMAFSNSGRLLKPGDRVDIVIGNFHARGLLVE
jgi:hypothetical protein